MHLFKRVAMESRLQELSKKKSKIARTCELITNPHIHMKTRLYYISSKNRRPWKPTLLSKQLYTKANHIQFIKFVTTHLLLLLLFLLLFLFCGGSLCVLCVVTRLFVYYLRYPKWFASYLLNNSANKNLGPHLCELCSHGCAFWNNVWNRRITTYQ